MRLCSRAVLVGVGIMSDNTSDPRAQWVARVLGVTIPGSVGAAPHAPSVQDLTTRLAKLAAQVKAAGTPPDMLDDLRAAGAALKGNDVGLAAGLLDEIEDRLASPKPAATAEEPPTPGPAANDRVVAEIRFRLAAAHDAREQARDNMYAACDSVLADPEAEEDPQFDEVQEDAADIGELMPTLPSDIDKAVGDMAARDPAKRDAARKRALTAVAKYRQEFDGVPALKILQDMGPGSFPVYDLVRKAIDDLEKALETEETQP
jgi:hypothetical protein